MAKLWASLSRRSRSFLVLLCLLIAVLLSAIDYLAGPELSFSIFYLFPVSLVTWLVGRRSGIFLSAVSAGLWFAADLLTRYPSYSHPAIPYWNAAVRLGFFLIVACATSALRSSQERREELAQFIVHDLRTPLSNVTTGLQTLREIRGEGTDAVQENLIEMCLVSCNRMLTLINSLLDLAQLESGHMSLMQSEVDAKGLIVASLEQVTVWARRNRVTLTSRLDPGVGTVYADSAVTIRVLVNLLSNAIKFSKPDSVVAIRAAQGEAGMVALSVADQGQGIPKALAGRVFDKFVQVDAHKTGGAAGSGLGLTFCRLAVEAQGGHIWLESEVDVGTTVTFTLPEGRSG
jgi:signal transduction histidine kinase